MGWRGPSGSAGVGAALRLALLAPESSTSAIGPVGGTRGQGEAGGPQAPRLWTLGERTGKTAVSEHLLCARRWSGALHALACLTLPLPCLLSRFTDKETEAQT